MIHYRLSRIPRCAVSRGSVIILTYFAFVLAEAFPFGRGNFARLKSPRRLYLIVP